MSFLAVGVSLGVGIYSANEAAGAARDANRRAERSEQAVLNFEKERYNDWQAVYGELQENMSHYYNNLSPDFYASTGIEAFNEEYEKSMTRLRENLTQRGIDPTSAYAMDVERQSEIDAAEARAGIRRDAQTMVQQEKLGFLQVGLGRNPANHYSSALQNQAIEARNRANDATDISNAAQGQVLNTLVDGAYQLAEERDRNE